MLAGAQESRQLSWSLEEYQGVDQAQRAIDNRLETGLVPVGIEVSDTNTFSLLFVARQAVEAMGIQIPSARIVTSNAQELRGFLNQESRLGFTAIDIAQIGPRIYVLMFPSSWTDGRYRLALAPDSNQSYEGTLRTYLSSDFLPAGVSLSSSDQGVAAWAFIQTENWTAPAISLSTYENNTATLQQGVSAALENGAVPWGFGLTDDQVLLLYVRLGQPASQE
jgi:hypothetical protein